MGLARMSALLKWHSGTEHCYTGAQVGLLTPASGWVCVHMSVSCFQIMPSSLWFLGIGEVVGQEHTESQGVQAPIPF